YTHLDTSDSTVLLRTPPPPPTSPLSLHDALPILATIYGQEPTHRERFTEALACLAYAGGVGIGKQGIATVLESATVEGGAVAERSEEHTSELQSRGHLVCRLLLEKKKEKQDNIEK